MIQISSLYFHLINSQAHFYHKAKENPIILTEFSKHFRSG